MVKIQKCYGEETYHSLSAGTFLRRPGHSVVPAVKEIDRKFVLPVTTTIIVGVETAPSFFMIPLFPCCLPLHVWVPMMQFSESIVAPMPPIHESTAVVARGITNNSHFAHLFRRYNEESVSQL